MPDTLPLLSEIPPAAPPRDGGGRPAGDTLSSPVAGGRLKKPRDPNQWFITPAHVTAAILDREVFPGRIWECACGNGAMAEVLKVAGYDVFATDLVQRGYGTAGVDFLQQTKLPDGVESIVTNPPFRLWLEFVLHALELGARKVAVIGHLTSLEGERRYRELFRSRPPSRQWVFSSRVTMWVGGDPNARDDGGSKAFMWSVWERHHAPSPVGWIP